MVLFKDSIKRTKNYKTQEYRNEPVKYKRLIAISWEEDRSLILFVRSTVDVRSPLLRAFGDQLCIQKMY